MANSADAPKFAARQRQQDIHEGAAPQRTDALPLHNEQNCDANRSAKDGLDRPQRTGHIADEQVKTTGLPRRVRADIIAECLEAGLTAREADMWARGWSSKPDSETCAAHAAEFARRGFPVDEAIRWHQDGFDAEFASFHRKAGLGVAQSVKLSTYAGGYAETLDWLSTGLSAETILDCVKAGLKLTELPRNLDQSFDEIVRTIVLLQEVAETPQR